MKNWIKVVALQASVTRIRQVFAERVDVTLIAAYKLVNVDGSFLHKPLFNDTLPGPPIECLKGDVLRINIINDMKKEELSMHWHAMNVPNHLDGAPYVTEVPLSPGGASQVYEFIADTAGTFHYHASQEFIRISLHGIIIVKEHNSVSDPLVYDHGMYEDLMAIQSGASSSSSYPTLIATDIYHKDSATLASQLDNGVGDWIWQPQSIVVNGWGMYDCSVNYKTPYYFRCTWQCPAEDTECIDEVRCSKATHPFSGSVLGPYVWEEQGSNALYNELIASNPSLYTDEVQKDWSIKCGWDHISPFLYGSDNEIEADGRPIGSTGVHQNQFLNWGRPTGTKCDLPDHKDRDPRCLADGTWPFKGMNKGRTYDHLKTKDGNYNVTHFDQADINKYNALCRATRFYTGDAQPESNHYPFGLFGQSLLKCDEYAQSIKKSESPAIFEVEAGKMYRLRAINVASLRYVTLVIEGHSMIVVQVDGEYIEPFKSNFLDLWNGQTYSVLIKADADTQGDFWIGLGIRHRGYTRMDPGRAILRYVTKNSTNGETTPVASEEKRLPMDKSRPVPKWWDAAPKGQYTHESGNKPKACPVTLHSTVHDNNRDFDKCPGFYPHFADQDISMEHQYRYRSRNGTNYLPSLTDPNSAPVWIVQNMNLNDYLDIDTYKACASDYGNSDVQGNIVNAYSYAFMLGDNIWEPLYSRFRPNTDIAGKDKKLCGVQRWSVNNITYSFRYTKTNNQESYKKPLLQHAYDDTLKKLKYIVDVRRPDETKYFSSFPEGYYNSINPNELGGKTKIDQGVPPASHELYNIMNFDLGEVFDVVMQNTVYLKYWTNALYGDKHDHRSGSNHHPYHSHGFSFWTLGYGEGNFNETAWNFTTTVSTETSPVKYSDGLILYKNMENPPRRNLAVNFAGGWTVLRIKADKPGLWLFHCTVMSHYYMGMGTTFGVGLNKDLPEPNPFVETELLDASNGSFTYQTSIFFLFVFFCVAYNVAF